MPMNAGALAQVIQQKTQQKVSAITPPPAGSEPAVVIEYGSRVQAATALAIAEAVVEHIQTAAQVLPGIAVATAGGPSNQTGATTAPGVIL